MLRGEKVPLGTMDAAPRSRTRTRGSPPQRRRTPSSAAPLRAPGSARKSSQRLLRSALVLVVLTWVPGALGGAVHLSLLRSWGVASGYAGISWALPAFLVGLAASRAARDRGLAWKRAPGVAVGVAAAIVLALGAASVVGS